ncbi:MAG: PH domain-containing protein [Myxococcota bacterium]
MNSPRKAASTMGSDPKRPTGDDKPTDVPSSLPDLSFDDDEVTEIWDPALSETTDVQLVAGVLNSNEIELPSLPEDIPDPGAPHRRAPPARPNIEDEEQHQFFADEEATVIARNSPMFLPRDVPASSHPQATAADAAPATFLSAGPASAGPSPEDDPEPVVEAKWKGLHPASLFINLLPQMWRTLRGLWPLLLLLIVGNQNRPPGAEGSVGMELVIILTFFLLSIARTVVHFLTLRYRLQAGRLEIKSGLLNRRSRVLDPNRIQNIELAQNPFHKLAGLVELRIETAGDASTEGMLSALDVNEAEALKSSLEGLVRSRQGADAAAPDDDGELLVRNSLPELLAFGLSKRRIGTVALLFAVGMEALTYLDPTQTQQVVSSLTTPRLIGAILLAFSGTLLFSGGQAIIQHFGFWLRLRGDRLVSREGLLTRRSVEIPRSKVQIIRVDQPWLRRQMGYGTMYIETAALGMADGEVRQAEGVIPMAPNDALDRLVNDAAPDVAIDPWSATLRPAHPRALYRLCIAGLVRSSGLAVVLIALLPWPYAFGALALVPLSLPISWLDWRHQGWLVTPQAILSRRGFLKRQTWVIARNKLQSVHMGQTPLMRWHGLAGVSVSVAGSEVRLPDVGLNTGHEILEELRETWLPSRHTE